MIQNNDIIEVPTRTKSLHCYVELNLSIGRILQAVHLHIKSKTQSHQVGQEASPQVIKFQLGHKIYTTPNFFLCASFFC